MQVHASRFVPMSPDLVTLARRKAALVKHHGPDDPRALEAAAELRVTRLLRAIEEELDQLTQDDRIALAAVLGA